MAWKLDHVDPASVGCCRHFVLLSVLEDRRWTRTIPAVFDASIHPRERFAVTAQEAEGEVNREYAIKAVYLYNFAHYVQWPADADSQGPFVIGVLGRDPFGALLDEIASSKRLEGRAIAVKRFASAEQYEACHILFLTASATAAQKKAAAGADSRPAGVGGRRRAAGRDSGSGRQLLPRRQQGAI